MTADSQLKSRPYDAAPTGESDAQLRFNEWQTFAEESLRGRSLNDLAHQTLDGIPIRPLYQPATVSPGNTDSFPFTRGQSATPESNPARIKQCYDHPAPHHCNKQILEELNRGVTSIHLDYFSSRSQCTNAHPATHRGIVIESTEALAATLNGVLPELVPISISAGSSFLAAAEYLRNFWSSKSISGTQCLGAFNADPLGVLASTGDQHAVSENQLDDFKRLSAETLDLYPQVTAALVDVSQYHDAGASPAQELGLMLGSYRYYLALLLEHGLEVNQVHSLIDIRLTVDSDYFMSIAKLRAARTVMAHLLKACGAEDQNCTVPIWATTSQRMLSRREPWVNILRGTVATAAANVGGANAISVAAFDYRLGETDAPGRRIARNTAIVLQEEASLHRICDPLGGSGYLESLTGSLCEKAWDFFQQIERTGGMAAGLMAGSVQSAINQTEQIQRKSLTTRSQTLVGISDFPSTDDALPTLDADAESLALDELADRPVIPPEELALTTCYLSAGFESIRESVDAQTHTTGQRPSIVTVAYGNTPAYLPRVQFCHNLLTAVGIESNEPNSPQDVESMLEQFEQAVNDTGRQCVLLCPALRSDDSTIVALIGHLASAGATEIFVANAPVDTTDIPEISDEKAPPGKAGATSVHYLYRGCDAIKSLEQIFLATGGSTR